MDAKKCDACGKLYEVYDGRKLFPKKGESNTIQFINDALFEFRARKSFDVCPDCMAKVVSILFPERNDKESKSCQ